MSQSLRRRGLLSFLVVLLLLTPALAQASTGVTLPAAREGPSAPTTAAWYDGGIQYSTITNCASIIQGAPYQENGIGTYVGFLADPDNSQPSPNTVYYLHLVAAGLGNPCSGTRLYLDIGLPASTGLAIDGSHPVYCFYDNTPLSAAECPQSLPSSSYNPGMYWIPSADTAHANTWPLPQGHFLEIQVPVRSTTVLTNSPFLAKVWALDGNSSPWLQPQVGIFVFSSNPSILYPSPSTTSITSTGAKSSAYLYSHGIIGTAWFDIGVDMGYTLAHDSVAIASGPAWLVWDDWTDSGGHSLLAPDTLYHWRLRFVAGDGRVFFGADQTFRTLTAGTAVVGQGMASSCTQAGLTSALSSATQVSFSCGMTPMTITLSSPLTIAGSVTIDGGGIVTLAGSGASNLLQVPSGQHLTLSRITLADGHNSSACGGAISVAGGASLTLDRAVLRNNVSGVAGGAVCVQNTGSANIQLSTFTKNQAGTGGAIENYGSVTLAHSVLTLNTATTMGAGIQTTGSVTASDTQFLSNSAGVNGGGIDNTGTLTASGLSFTGNSAGFRGGGLYNYLGQFSLTASNVTNNTANAYGGGVGNDSGTGTIDDTTFSGNNAKGSGGGVSNYGSPAIVTIRRSTIAGNQANTGNTAGNGGGGLANTGSLSLANSTVSGNQALNGAQGGGLYATGGTATLLNDTFAENVAGQGGNIHSAAAVIPKNTLLAAGSPNNCDGAVTSQGHNLESANTCGLQPASGDVVNGYAGLGTLAANGGPTLTRALIPGSQAIDAGTNTGCPATDQRGVVRPIDGNGDHVAVCDIGAFEASPPRVYLPLIRR